MDSKFRYTPNVTRVPLSVRIGEIERSGLSWGLPMSDHISRALDRVQPRFRFLTASRFWLGTTCLLLLILQGCGESNESGGLAGPDPSSSDDVGFRTQPPVSQDAAPEPVGCVDRDGDGFGDNCEAGPDCNDRQASAHQGATEQCGDGFDNDCDDRVDEGCGCTEGEAVPCYPAADGNSWHRSMPNRL